MLNCAMISLTWTRSSSARRRIINMPTSTKFLLSTVAAVGFSTPLAFPVVAVAQTAVTLDADDIGGTVTGSNGPEAGVWVIAETMDLPTRFARMVVTDDLGRYVVPDLP